MTRPLVAAALVVVAAVGLAARADNASAQRPKPGEFPPLGSARQIAGELTAADFVHRSGQFRVTATGEAVDFVLPPFGTVQYLNAEADLRDVPLGTYCQFFLTPDQTGAFTRLVAARDQFTTDAGDGASYRLTALKLAEGKLLAARHRGAEAGSAPGTRELLVSDLTRVWKGNKPAKLADLAVGDELLFNLTGKTATAPGRCSDLWVGADAHKLATDRQREAQAAFLRARGLPGWVDQTDGRTLTVSLFSGDRATFARAGGGDFMPGRGVRVVVANDELRTWNPPVDNERGKVVEVLKGPVDCFGSSGVRLVVTVNVMLEGFRKGRVVRVFPDGRPLKDQPFGEQLFHYGTRSLPPELAELPPKEYPDQFPFRTDHGNEHLSWYRLQPGVAPPPHSEHRVSGELVAAAPDRTAGRFRADRTGEVVEFSLTPGGRVRYLNAEVGLGEVPPGTRCWFHLYQDDAGAFRRATLVTDEVSDLATNGMVWRVEVLKLGEGKLYAARQPPAVKNYNGDPEQPPDTGRAELRVGPETRVWKGDQRVKLADLAVGDLLLVNRTGERPGHPSVCTDVWAGVETHARFTAPQRKRVGPPKRVIR